MYLGCITIIDLQWIVLSQVIHATLLHHLHFFIFCPNLRNTHAHQSQQQ
jgi:hypothetical protein